MKRTTRYEQKPVEVILCDTCNKEIGPSKWAAYCYVDWSENCPHDDCWSDRGEMAFCSHRCFEEGIDKLADKTDPNDDVWAQSVTLTFRSRGAGDNLSKFFKWLSEGQR